MKSLSNPYRFYRYVYYRLYSWSLKTWGKSDLPHINAMLGMSFLCSLHMGTVIFIVNSVFFLGLFYSHIPKSVPIALFIISLAVNYFIFLDKQKYKRLEQEFAADERNTYRTLLMWLYIISSFTLFLISATLPR